MDLDYLLESDNDEFVDWEDHHQHDIEFDEDLDENIDDMFDNYNGKNKIRKQPLGSFIPSHLAMPIVNDDVDFLLDNEKLFCPRHKKLRIKIEELKITESIYDIGEDPYKIIKDMIINSTSLSLKTEKDNFLKNLTTASLSSSIHKVNFFGKSCNKNIENQVVASFKEMAGYITSRFSLIEEDFILMKKVEQIKDEICSKRIPFGELIKYKSCLFIERDIFFIKLGSGKWVIGPTNLFLCVLDIHQSRFPKILYWLVADCTRKYPVSMYDTATKLIKEFENLRSKLENQFFKFIATWESLIIGYVINDSDNDLGFSELYNSSFLSMTEILQNSGVVYDLATLLPTERTTDWIKLYIELLGNTKHFGHPYLNLLDGFNNVRKYGTESVFIDQDVVSVGVAIMRRDFVKNYLLKKKKWPPCKEVPESLIKYYKRGLYPSSEEKSYESWSQLRFDKVFEYDLSPDTTELIKDSSAADEFNCWFAEYDNCAFRILYNKPKPTIPPTRKPTRVIQRFLEGNEEDLEKKIHELKNNYFNPNDSTACLCRKEQELKPDGRLFVKQTYLQRLGQTSMESNIANQYLRFVPEQTMTDGEIQLMRRLADAAKSQNNQTTEILNLDLSKWNMRFRHALVRNYGVVLDELFDTGVLYTNNHYWFIKANIFCNSRLAPPDYDENLNPIPGIYYYNNQLGGMEGMRQKLWTTITITLIKYSAEKESLSINIMCQGDNQVVMINYPPMSPEERKIKRDKFLRNLHGTLQSVNLTLKTEETWFSNRLCEFGKVRYFRGEAVSNSDKKFNRCIPDINDGVCSIMSSLSTINTITESAAKCDYSPDRMFFLNQAMVLNFLQRNKIILSQDDVTDRLAYLFHPTDFGGISLSSYFSHTIRGYDDKLTLWLSLLKTLKNMYKQSFMKTLRLNKVEPRSSRDYSKLVEDIFSLNIINLPSVEKKMKNLALAYLVSPFVTNPEITKIFSSEANKKGSEIVASLIKMEPFIPSIAHEILRNSNSGILLSLRNQFSNLTTINNLVQELTPSSLQKITNDISYIPEDNRDKQYDFLEIANINNRAVVRIIRSRTKARENYYIDQFVEMECPAEASAALRKIHWDLNILGASRPYPPCQFYLKELDKCDNDQLEKSILITLSTPFSNMTSLNYLTDGPYNAYMGSATKEKIKKPTLDVVAKTSFTKSLQQLYLIKSWCQRLNAYNLEKLVDELIEEKNSIIPDTIQDLDSDDWCATVWGGNILHRFRSMIEKDAAVINFLSTQATHVKQSTNNLASITAGGKDFTIHFQLILIYNTITLGLIKEYEYLGVKQFCSVLTCPGCTKEVTSVKVDLTDFTPTIIKMDKILTTERAHIFDSFYSDEEIIYAISIHLGKLFGASCDLVFMQKYIIDKAGSSRKMNHETSQISINDLRYVNFGFCIIGIISNSRVIKKSLLTFGGVELYLQRAQYLENLAVFLINGGLLEELLKYLGVTITEHNQGLDPLIISSILLVGIHKWFRENFKKYASILIGKVFSSDEDYFVYNNQKFLRAYHIYMFPTLNKQEYLSLRLDANKIKNNRVGIQLISKFPNHFPLARRMNEDRVVSYLRTQLAVRKIIPGNLKAKISVPDHQTSPLLIMSYINLLGEYYDGLQGFAPGDFSFKDSHQIARPFGSISTAINKVLEIINIFSPPQFNISNIYCLAEGSGSILEGLGSIFPLSKLFYNSLLTPEVDMRQGADQDYPPAILNSKVVNQRRIMSEYNLAKGETDITKTAFLRKLEHAFSDFPPSIVTMDAESNEISKNDVIFLIHLPILIKYNTNMFIYKIFLEKEFFITIDELEIKYQDYYIFLIKPICSNINNKEFYIVGIKKQYVNHEKVVVIRRISNLMLSTYNRNILSSFQAFRYFVVQSRKLNKISNQIYPNMTKLTPSGLFLTGPEKQCNYFCKHNLYDMLNLIYQLDTFDHELNYLYPIIRNGGIYSNYKRLFFLILTQIVIINSGDMILSVVNFNTEKIERAIRSGIIEPESTLADHLKDWKGVLRIMSHDLNFEKITCNCNLTNKEIKLRETILKTSIGRNLEIWMSHYFTGHPRLETLI